MAWSKCTIEIGDTGASDAMATVLVSVGIVKDKSSSLEPSDGDSLEAKASGGELVAKELLEGGFKLKTRVVEPEDALYTALGLGTVATDELQVKTHVVSEYQSVKVTPKNVGAKGIKAPKTLVSFKPGWSEEDGNYVDLEFDILKGDAAYWYSKFTKAAV